MGKIKASCFEGLLPGKTVQKLLILVAIVKDLLLHMNYHSLRSYKT